MLYNGQSIFDGIINQKVFIAGLLLFYIVDKFVKAGVISLDELKNILLFCAILQLILYFLQYAIGPEKMFLSCYYTTPALDSRVTRVRLYGSVANIGFSYIYILSTFSEPKKKFSKIVFILSTLLFAVIINQGRSYIIQMVALLIFALLLYKSGFSQKMIAFCVGVTIIVMAVNSDYFVNVMDTFQNSTVDSNNTIGVRLRSQEFYLNFWKNHPILVGGYSDPQNSHAVELAGVSNGYLFVDNGIFGLLFRYGILGVIWYLYTLLYMCRNGCIIFKQSGNSMLLLKVFSLLLGVMTSVSAFDGFGIFYKGLYLVFASNMQNDIHENKE